MNYNNILSVLLENTSKSQKYILIKKKKLLHHFSGN